jgi:flavin reductase (DIM6/NTAB) family NADH-FMN oxidoreductase RutF
MHHPSEPPILYLGTPVVLISTTNEDGSPNLAPMSSAFWLGWRCVLGLGARGKTAANLVRTGECVLNLPSQDQVAAVNRLALTTGSNPVPDYKQKRGYRYVRDKFGISGLTPVDSETVRPPRVLECPVQLEASLAAVHELAEDDEAQRGGVLVLETRVRRVHLDDEILMPDQPNRIDPDRWRPLIMSFQQFYGLTPNQLQPSGLATIPESEYRGPDIERGRGEAKRVAR